MGSIPDGGENLTRQARLLQPLFSARITPATPDSCSNPLVRFVDRFPDIGCEFLLKLRFIDGGESILNRLMSHGLCDREADGTNAGLRRQEIGVFVLSGRRKFSERDRRSFDHRVGNMPSPGRDYAEGEPGKM